MSARPADLSASGFHRPDLQGLRAVAVALVALEHAGLPGLPGGFIGVDVFFVLSGYLITGLLLREHAATGRLDIGRFLVRRAHRLLPAMAVMLLVTAAVAATVLAPVELDRRAASLPYAAVWASNLYFAFADVDYFGEPGGRDLFLHTWSLGVEEQFYVLWPALLLLVFGLCRHLPARVRSAVLPVSLGAVALASLGLAWYWMAAQPLWPFYLMPARVWQLAFGALLCVLARPLAPHTGRLLVACGLLVLLACGLWLHRALVYPGYWALLPVLGSGLVILGGQGEPRRGVLAHAALTWVGDRSYSLYLWHWPVLMLGEALGLTRGGSGIGLLVGLSVLLAMGSYRGIEQPFWKGRLAARVTRQSALAAGLIMALAVSGGFQYLAQTRSAMQEAGPDLAAVRADVPPIYAAGCDTWYQSAELTPCVVGAVNAPHTVVLLGDSILAQWFSLLPALFPAPQWRIVVFTKSACPMVDEDYFYVRINRTYTVCTQWRRAVLEHLARLRPEVVITGSYAGYDFTPGQWAEGSRRVLRALAEAAGKVVLVPGTPALDFDGPGCVAAQTAPGPAVLLGRRDCRTTGNLAQVTEVRRYLQAAVDGHPNVVLLDLGDLVCPNGVCAARNAAGTLVFRDNQHLTDSFVRAHVPAVAARLRALGVINGWLADPAEQGRPPAP